MTTIKSFYKNTELSPFLQWPDLKQHCDWFHRQLFTSKNKQDNVAGNLKTFITENMTSKLAFKVDHQIFHKKVSLLVKSTTQPWKMHRKSFVAVDESIFLIMSTDCLNLDTKGL